MNRNVLFMVGYREQIDFLTFSTVCTFWSTLTKMCRHISCAISCAVILFQIKFMSWKHSLYFFSAYYIQVPLLSFFWWCFALSCPTEVSTSSKRPSYYSVSVCRVPHTKTFQTVLWDPLHPKHWKSRGGEGGTSTVAAAVWIKSLVYLVWTDKSVDGTKASVSKFPVNKQLASLRVLSSESSSWTCSSSCSTAIATESWRGKKG